VLRRSVQVWRLRAILEKGSVFGMHGLRLLSNDIENFNYLAISLSLRNRIEVADADHR
jgi:hypothetical protein